MHRCNAVDPKVVIGEPSVVFSLADVGCIGVFVAVFNLSVSGVPD